MEKRYLIKHLSQQLKKVRLRRKLSTGLRRDLRPEGVVDHFREADYTDMCPLAGK
jgi:hypothetical protein